MGRTQGTPGQRDRVYGRLGREHKSWVWKAEKNDLTFNILESRSRLDVPSGRNLSKIIDKSFVQKSSAGSWPKQFPPSDDDTDFELAKELARKSHIALHGQPGSENYLKVSPTDRYPMILNQSSHPKNPAHEGSSSIQGTVSGLQEPSLSSSYQAREYFHDHQNDHDNHHQHQNQHHRPYDHHHQNEHKSGGGAEQEEEEVVQRDIPINVNDDNVIDDNNGEELEDEESKRKRLLIETLSESKKLTYSMKPSSSKKFNPSDIPWDNRHHISVSSKNHVLHNIHRDFFDQPRGFDMCTKPRKRLPIEPITEKLMKTIDKEELRIFPRSPSKQQIYPPPRSANSRLASSRRGGGGMSQPSTRPVSRPTMSPIRDGEVDEPYHSDSFLQPYALSRRSSGNRLYVPASLSL
jgi:hypothetical protein